MVQTIGTNGSKIAQMVMTDSIFQTNVMTDGNLVQNGSFANGSAFGWEYHIGSPARADNRVDGWYASLSRRDLYSTYDVSVVSGETLYVSIKAWGDDNQPLMFGMRFFDKNNEDIDWRSAFYPTTNNTPKDYTGTIKVPDKAAYGRVWVSIDRWDNYGILWFTNAKITRSATQSQVTQLANNWAVRMLNSKNDIVSQINLSDSTFLIEAKNIVGLGDAVINGKLTVTGDMIAGTISADKISGGTLTGTTFLTTENSTGFSTRLANGTIEFRHQLFSLGHIHATLNGNTGNINGFAVVQRPGYIFSINSRSNLPNVSSSTAVIQVPADSTSESRKLNIYAQGGLRIYSDVLDLENDMIKAKKPLRINGLVASHAQTNAGANISDAGNLMYSIDRAGSVMIHRLMVRSKAGNWPNSGIALCEDGRVAVVVNGVWKQP